MSTELQQEIIDDILRIAREEGWPAGTPVGEKTLADRLGVSRTPVRGALTQLVAGGVLQREPGLGFRLARTVDSTLIEAHHSQRQAGGTLHRSIMADRAEGRIGDEVTENALIARYGASRGDVRRALQKLSADGIVQRQRGHGWRFGESLDTPQAIAESYAFREAIETAALRQRDYRVDRAELERMRGAHRSLLARPASEVPAELWFAVNSGFHEALAAWSRNRFFLQAVRRQNALRRMHQFADFSELTHDQIRQSCEEHLAILDALAAGDRSRAAALLGEHLRLAGRDWES